MCKLGLLLYDKYLPCARLTVCSPILNFQFLLISWINKENMSGCTRDWDLIFKLLFSGQTAWNNISFFFKSSHMLVKLRLYLVMEEIRSSVLMNGFLCMSAQVVLISFTLHHLICFQCSCNSLCHQVPQCSHCEPNQVWLGPFCVEFACCQIKGWQCVSANHWYVSISLICMFTLLLVTS